MSVNELRVGNQREGVRRDTTKQRQAGPTRDNMTSVLLCRGVAKVEGPGAGLRNLDGSHRTKPAGR